MLSNLRESAAWTNVSQPGMTPPVGSPMGLQGRSWAEPVPVRGAAARLAADSPSQPSMGQVLVSTERIDIAALEPSRRSIQRLGVVFSETSVQVMPPVPMRTVAPNGSRGAAGWAAVWLAAAVSALSAAWAESGNAATLRPSTVARAANRAASDRLDTSRILRGVRSGDLPRR